MAALQGKPGEIRFTIEIHRAATGKTETVELIGVVGDQPAVVAADIEPAESQGAQAQKED